ncbi:DUF6697 family protein [Pseudoalteromonas sp. S16_S37]|uniref:DUF6697 family protein n=1 Tax=Pseudoalteromonas sp. S16_S37 TaxID=2720228 RepID=UPI001680D934|nr:DUF6697 family protein [Pseudoalteromonas sp. S16_S37]MBD1582741.1 hypothetical protein [Pseudoalteromonas sp. S16_S37]
MFDKAKTYTRKEIQALVGGEIQTYLPQRNKQILAGCFNLELNPDCPVQIQAGKSGKVKKKAELVMSQMENEFPVFAKEGKKSKYYSYLGKYRCVGGTCDPKELAQAEQKSGRHGALSYVFNLVPADK